MMPLGSFCNSTAGCGCPICPDCRPGRPCAHCDPPGQCVVCRGVVPPGSLELATPKKKEEEEEEEEEEKKREEGEEGKGEVSKANRPGTNPAPR